jgi:hypothetical protein
LTKWPFPRSIMRSATAVQEIANPNVACNLTHAPGIRIIEERRLPGPSPGRKAISHSRSEGACADKVFEQQSEIISASEERRGCRWQSEQRRSPGLLMAGKAFFVVHRTFRSPDDVIVPPVQPAR